MNLHCPGKVFVLGEYACLVGSPALLLACKPGFDLRFEYPVSADRANAFSVFATESPAGRLLQQNSEITRQLFIEWKDPYSVPIGVGSSSAQFVLTARAIAGIKGKAFSENALLQLYWQTVGESQGLRPSGVDVVLQAFGRHGVVTNHPFSIRPLSDEILRGSGTFLLAYSGRKTKTHDHLKEMYAKGFPENYSNSLSALASITERGFAAWESRNLKALGVAMNQYQMVLNEMAAAPENFSNAIASIQMESGVFGCKGAGAQGGDCILVLAEKAGEEEVKRALRHHGFEPTSVTFDLKS